MLQAFGETDVHQVLKELGFDGEPDLEPLPDEIADVVMEAMRGLISSSSLVETRNTGRQPGENEQIARQSWPWAAKDE